MNESVDPTSIAPLDHAADTTAENGIQSQTGQPFDSAAHPILAHSDANIVEPSTFMAPVVDPDGSPCDITYSDTTSNHLFTSPRLHAVARELFEHLDLEGRLVSLDALHTTRVALCGMGTASRRSVTDLPRSRIREFPAVLEKRRHYVH